jgi:membrane associated rhomboid family serine protease
MIFPFLKGFLSFRRAPITWTLIALNALVMLWGWSVSWDATDKLDALMSDDYFVEVQGRIYDRYLKEGRMADSEVVRELANVDDADRHRVRILGHLAFRDDDFFKQAMKESFTADTVALDKWRSQVKQIEMIEGTHPSYLLGISMDATDYVQWITYIFSHTSGWHYFGNMIFLLLFGAALEEAAGGLALLVIFTLTGVFAAGFFLLLCGPSPAPLIGASGAISGVMAMFCVLNWNKPCRFVYWLFLPTREGMGFIYFPAWVGFVVFVSSDIAGFFGNLDVLGGVAHAAHLGGDIAGVIAGIAVLASRKFSGSRSLPEGRAPEMWKLYPFFNLYRIHRTQKLP